MLTATDSTVDTFVVVTPDVQVRGMVQQVLWNLQSSNKYVERRRAQRHAYPYPLRIWPARECLKGDSLETASDGTVVMGKHLSAGGVDFYTHEPIADRRIVVSLEHGDSQPFYVLTELTWCRFGGHGMYLNGGRFLRALEKSALEQSGGIPAEDKLGAYR